MCGHEIWSREGIIVTVVLVVALIAVSIVVLIDVLAVLIVVLIVAPIVVPVVVPIVVVLIVVVPIVVLVVVRVLGLIVALTVVVIVGLIVALIVVLVSTQNRCWLNFGYSEIEFRFKKLSPFILPVSFTYWARFFSIACNSPSFSNIYALAFSFFSIASRKGV